MYGLLYMHLYNLGGNKRMKQKILIGSIFASLLLLSMPFVSTLQARPVQPVPMTNTTYAQPPATVDPTVSLSEIIVEAEMIFATLSQTFPNDVNIQTLCREANVVLNNPTDGPVCDLLRDIFYILVLIMVWAATQEKKELGQSIFLLAEIIYNLNNVLGCPALMPSMDGVSTSATDTGGCLCMP